MSDNILVTGATGLIGSYLCKRLIEEGNKVCGVSHHGNVSKIQSIINNEDFNLRVGDIRDENFVHTLFDRKIETVFHLAAQVPYDKAEKDYFGINLGGTMNLCDVSHENKVEKFIYSSSISVYSHPKYLPVDENHPAESPDIYGESKLQGERYCQLFADRMEMVILRFAGAYGIGSDRVIPKFVRCALKNEPLTINGDGTHSSDFVYIDDIVQGTILAWRKGVGIYNIGSGREMSLKGLAEIIIELTSSKSKIIFNSDAVERPFRFYADISKARRELDYNPLSLESGLKIYIESVKRGM